MKIKMLAIAISGVLLAGCNDSNGERQSFSVQAFDPAIYNMPGLVLCEDGTEERAKTDFSGNAKFFEATVLTSPETCEFTFTGDANSKDVTNGKVIDLEYKIPKGLAKAGSLVTASPLTTLIYNELKINDLPYDSSVADQLFQNLGIDTIFSDTTSIDNFLRNTSVVISNAGNNASKLSATTAVLSDVLQGNKENSNTTVTALEAAKSAKALTDEILSKAPNYPTGPLNTTIYVDISKDDVKNVVDQVEAGDDTPTVPDQTGKLPTANPVTPPTGATGGNGPTGGTGA